MFMDSGDALQVATLSATLEDYDRAIEIFEEVAIAMLDNSLLKWSAKENFFKAGICRLCSGDTVAAQKHIERYESICAGFRDTRESKLCKVGGGLLLLLRSERGLT